ncbi:hypothetical protein [Absidia glauca]|uniref:Uncharacterized protein n=1 Tax=Absidia glauca TaxID=4829 RepID=A0A163KXR5_ABSGL|nr:hypothetical protein [Absidia glauca]
MDSPSRLHTAIYWTRTTVLVTSMLIFILALTNYSRSTLPIATLLSKDDPHQLLLALIEDRRLITTLASHKRKPSSIGFVSVSSRWAPGSGGSIVFYSTNTPPPLVPFSI